MAIPGTVTVTAIIAPTSTGDTYPVTDSIYAIDGLRNVNTNTDRNSISNDRRRQGMLVGVNSTGTTKTIYWSLLPSPWNGTDSDWVLFESGSSSGGTSDSLWTSGSTGYQSIKTNNDSGLDSIGDYSVAEGNGTLANGLASHAEGFGTTASGDYGSHAEGSNTTAFGARSHAEGSTTTALGNFSHSEGVLTTATGQGSHSEGSTTIASGDTSHAEGKNTIAAGNTSHAEGYYVTAIGDYSHAEGVSTTAFGNRSHAEGEVTIAGGEASHSEGNTTYALGGASHAEGNTTYALGGASHAEGQYTSALTIASHAGGMSTFASGGTTQIAIPYIATDNITITLSDPTYATPAVVFAGDVTAEWQPYLYNYCSEFTIYNSSGLTQEIDVGCSAYDIYYDAGSDSTYFVDPTISSTTYTDISGNTFQDTFFNETTAYAEGMYTTASGASTHAEGQLTTAIGQASHAEGFSTTGLGIDSHAEGNTTIASGSSSHAEGTQTTAIGDNSHAEGTQTRAIGSTSHAEGSQTTAIGNGSHAEGFQTVAVGDNSHVEGNGNTALGGFSHAEGGNTKAIGSLSHSEGISTTAVGNYSHAEGQGNVASGAASHVEGFYSTVITDYSHAEGYQTTASGQYGSHSEGFNTKATGATSHAEGYQTSAFGNYSHAEGINTIALNTNSHAEGDSSKASGQASHAEGQNTQALGDTSHAEGGSTLASGQFSHSENYGTQAIGNTSHAEGFITIAIGGNSHTEGQQTTAFGINSHAGGNRSIASGNTSFIHSSFSNVTGDRSVLLGGQNLSGASNDTVYVPYFNIHNLFSGTSIYNLGVDNKGNVVSATTVIVNTNFVPLTGTTSANTITGPLNFNIPTNAGIGSTTGSFAVGYNKNLNNLFDNTQGTYSASYWDATQNYMQYLYRNPNDGSIDNVSCELNMTPYNFDLNVSNYLSGNLSRILLTDKTITLSSTNSGFSGVTYESTTGNYVLTNQTGLSILHRNANDIRYPIVTGISFNNSTYDLTIKRNDNISLTSNLGILASDMTVTGGTYNSITGVATFTNNSGGSFNVSGFLTGFTDIKTTAFTYSNNVFNITQSDNSKYTAVINTMTGLTINGSLSATTYLGLPNDINVTGGTYSAGTAVFTNNTGGTFSVTGFSTGGGGGVSKFALTTGLTANTPIIVSHNLNSLDVMAQIKDLTANELIVLSIDLYTLNSIRITSNVNIASIRVIVIG
jgi:hypothetical protein